MMQRRRPNPRRRRHQQTMVRLESQVAKMAALLKDLHEQTVRPPPAANAKEVVSTGAGPAPVTGSTVFQARVGPSSVAGPSTLPLNSAVGPPPPRGVCVCSLHGPQVPLRCLSEVVGFPIPVLLPPPPSWALAFILLPLVSSPSITGGYL